MIRLNYKSNTIVVFLFSIIFIWFFFFTKHSYSLSKVNVFGDDPYDAVGSIGIQVSFFAASLSMIRVFMSYFYETLPISQIVMILRGNIVSLLSIGVTIITDLIALFRFLENWRNDTMGLVILGLVGIVLILAIALVYWVLTLAKEIGSSFKLKNISIMTFWPLLGFLILAIYPVKLRDSIIGEIITAFTGMVIQITIVKSLSILMIPKQDLMFFDLIDVIDDLYVMIKKRLKFGIIFLESLEKGLNNSKVKVFIDWLNPRKHKWNLAIIIGIIIGITLIVVEGSGEHWLRINKMAFLLFSIFFVGELIIVLSFYVLFGNYLGIIKTDKRD